MQLGIKWSGSGYPPQLWLLVGGSLVTAVGYTIAFPFLTLYLNSQLSIPMDRIGLLFIGNAAAGLVAQIIGGPLADRFGRKPVMLVGLLVESLNAVAFTRATEFPHFVLIAALHGFFASLFAPASNAMVVDLVGIERRAAAFGLTRVALNLGWVVGPSLGGILATRISYPNLFTGTAIAMLLYSIALWAFARETLPQGAGNASFHRPGTGYGTVLRDGAFMVLIAASVLVALPATQLTTTIPVYLKLEAGIPESGYGLLMALNAGAVALLQIPTTRLLERWDRTTLLAVGAAIYGAGFASLGWWQEMHLFAVSILVLSLGEMIVVPLAATAVSDLAPTHLRATYMSAYSLTWTLGFGLGPALGGTLMERWGTSWLWNSGLAAGCLGGLVYLSLKRWKKHE